MCIKNTTLLIMWSVCNCWVDICCCHSYKQKKELTVSICKVISLAGHEEVISGWLHQLVGWLGSVIFKESSVQIKGRYCYFKKYLFPFQPKRSKIISPTLLHRVLFDMFRLSFSLKRSKMILEATVNDAFRNTDTVVKKLPFDQKRNAFKKTDVFQKSPDLKPFSKAVFVLKVVFFCFKRVEEGV